jgi:hypothetical protein
MNDESIHRRLVTREDSFLKVVSLAGVTADVIKFVTRALARNDDGTFLKKKYFKLHTIRTHDMYTDVNREKKTKALAFKALTTLKEFEQEIRRVRDVSKTVDEELKSCSKRHDEFEEIIKNTRDEVEVLKVKLREEHKIRAEKEEAEALSKQINTYPTQEVSARSIEELNQALENLNKRYEDAVGKMELRTKQVRLLMQCVQDLENVLSSDGGVDNDGDAMEVDE